MRDGEPRALFLRRLACQPCHDLPYAISEDRPGRGLSPTRSGRERSSRNDSLAGWDPVFHLHLFSIRIIIGFSGRSVTRASGHG